MQFAWSWLQIDQCTPGDGGVCATEGLTPPVDSYHHGAEWAVIGGYVARGAAVPSLHGWDLCGDLCRGRIMGLTRADDGWAAFIVTKTPLMMTSFGEEAEGGHYATDLAGRFSRVVERPDGVTGWRVP